MGYTTDTTYDGIRERQFTVRDIPGVLWTPVSDGEHTPLVLLGHGGGLDRMSPPMTGRARLLVAAGLAAVCIDAPGHGTRPRTAELLGHVRDVMNDALAAGGTSFDSLYVNVNGESGYFDRSLDAYGREGLPCKRCATPMRRRPWMNRSSYFCPKCQRSPRVPS